MSSIIIRHILLFFFFFNDTATTEIYTLSLHDALPILFSQHLDPVKPGAFTGRILAEAVKSAGEDRSEEHTSELQSRPHLVCRLLLEKKKKYKLKNRHRPSSITQGKKTTHERLTH